MKIEHPEVEKPEGEEEETHPPCPTCNEEWDGNAIFCFWCGYEESDEENPLHPLPELDAGVSDAADVLSEDEKSGLKAVIGESGMNVPIFFVTFRTPEEFSPSGIAFSLYNNWAVGRKNSDKGFLVLWDPERHRLEIATGKEFNRKDGVSGLNDAAGCLAQKISEGEIIDGFRQFIGGFIPNQTSTTLP